MAVNKMRVLSVKPYNNKDENGNKTDVQKGWIVEAILADVTDLEGKVDTFFPGLDKCSKDFFNGVKRFDPIEVHTVQRGVADKPFVEKIVLGKR